jgi:hypothetical protein
VVITDVINEVRQRLVRHGVKVSNADIQAILWYPEKDLWRRLRGEETMSQKDGSTAGDDENILNTSYDTEFLNLARSRGLGDAADAALTRARASRTGRPNVTGSDAGVPADSK